MKSFYLYIFILSIFIILMSYRNIFNSIEGFGFTNNRTYVFMGDSILKNNAYVSEETSIDSLMLDKNIQLYSFAEDHSKISDIFIQINKLPVELNNSNTSIFLSAGGNNILVHYLDNNKDVTNTKILKPMFITYKNLIKSIQTRLPEARIILLDIYYPNNLQYTQFHNIIKKWNNMVYDFADNPINNIYSVLRISNYLTNNEDFSFGIEPSSVGGKKIVDLILSV